MKANELRIGNLVWEEYGGIYEVININSEGFDYVDLRKPTFKVIGRYESEYIQPIPLTEEWILKFGLKPNQWFYENSFCIVEDITGDTHYGWCMKVQNASHTKEIEFGYFKYVHQLQNLYFALTGEELTIKE